MVTAVIFDMDGVIIDSEPLHKQVVIDVLKEFGVHFSLKDVDRFVGNTNKTLWTTLKDEYDLDVSVSELGRRQHEKNMEEFQSCPNILISGIEDLLQSLHESHHKTAIASSSNIEFIDEVVRKYRLEAFFNETVSGQEVKNGKPAPDIFIETAKRLGVAPDRCVVIEDSKNGVEAAKRAGMKVIGYLNPNSGNQDISRADTVVNSINLIDIELMNSLMKA